MAEKQQDELASSLNDLFSAVSAMIQSELQGTTNEMELLEKMNLRVADEYKGFGDVASGLSVFVEQLKSKTGGFDEYVKQIEAIDEQVTELEAVVSVVDKHVTMLESKVYCEANFVADALQLRTLLETADTLLDKRDAITKEMEDKKELLSIEKKRLASESTEESNAGDALDAFMTGFSTKLGQSGDGRTSLNDRYGLFRWETAIIPNGGSVLFPNFELFRSIVKC